VWTAPAGAATRMHLVYPAGINRASTFTMHGHVWQRDPYVCPHPVGSPMTDRYGLPGLCNKTGFYPTLPGFEVGSKAVGTNPIGFYKGEQDLIAPGAHFDLVLPSAGGANRIPGDYLFMDRTGFGNTSGLWGILRVQ
jgi:manganese oxidase